jgi:hypothetical protein
MITYLVKTTAKTTVGVTAGAVKLLSRPGLWVTRRLADVVFSPTERGRPPQPPPTTSSGKRSSAARTRKPRATAKPRSRPAPARKRAARETARPTADSKTNGATGAQTVRTPEQAEPTGEQTEPTSEQAQPTTEQAEPTRETPVTPASVEPTAHGVPGRDAPPAQPADPHHVLNTPVGEPDPTEWPDPYDQRPDPRDPEPDQPLPIGDVPHTPTGARSTSEPHPDQDPEAVRSEVPERDNLDD